MGRVFALANQKGGVGKTTTAVNLGAYLAAAGRHVLIVDADPQANATSSLGIVPRELSHSIYDALIGSISLEEIIVSTRHVRLDLVPSNSALAGAEVEMVAIEGREHLLRRALSNTVARYDYVLIDCPPSLGLLTINALTAARDGVIVPVQCEYLALEGLSRLWETIQLVRARLNPHLRLAGLVMTMYDGRTTLSRQVVAEVRRHFPGQVFSSIIPRSIRLGEAPSYGEPIISFAPRSAGARAYEALAHELMSNRA